MIVQLRNTLAKFGALDLIKSQNGYFFSNMIKIQNRYFFSGSSIVGKNGHFERGCYGQI
jgi:hypothetical protein